MKAKILSVVLALLIVQVVSAQNTDVRAKRVIADQSLFLRSWWADTLANDTLKLGPRTILTARAVEELIRGRSSTFTSKFKNGISSEGDSLRFGGHLSDSITHLFIDVDAKTTQSTLRKVPVLVYSNRTKEDDLVLSDWKYWRERGGNAVAWYQRLFNESDNDTAAQQYNGIINSFNRITQDFSSSRFDYDAGGKATPLQYNGVYAIAQLYPVKSTLIQPGWFGADGSVFAGAWGFGGRDSAYDISVQASTTAPVPISIFKADIDLNRAVSSSRSRTMTGIGVSGYTAGFRSYQSSQGTANTSNPSFIENVTQYTAIGSLEESPFDGQGLSKTDILARSEIRNAYGIHFQPQRTMANEVNNGFPIWQEGKHDFSYFEGKIRIGGSKPDRSTGDTMTQGLEVFDNLLFQGSNNLRFRGSALGTFPGMYWQLSPDSIVGSQANIDFNANASRDSRGLIIGVGTSSTATSGYPTNSGTGWFFEVRTGVNGGSRMRMERDGSLTLASSATLGTYLDSALLNVVGTGYFNDKVKLLAPGDSDSSNYAVTSAWVKRNAGSGGSGGSSANLSNSDLTQNAETRTYDVNSEDLYWDNISAMRWYGSDTHAGERVMEIDGGNAQWLGGRLASGVYYEGSDSLYQRGISAVTDTSGSYVYLQTPGGGTVKARAGVFGGSGGTSISFGSASQIPITNSNTHNFSYLNTFWIDSTNSRFTFGTSSSSTSPFHIYLGSDVNSPNPAGLRLSTATRAMNIGLGASNHGYFLQTGGDNAAGFVFLTRQSYPLVSMYRDQTNIYTNNIERAEWGLTELVLNDPGNDYDFRIETDTDTHALFVDGGNNGVVFGSSSLTSGSKVTVNGMIDVPGTEASTFRWNTTASESPDTPGTPAGYLRVNVAGTFVLIPYYAYTAP